MRHYSSLRTVGMDPFWSEHSVALPARLWERCDALRDAVTVLEPKAFFPFYFSNAAHFLSAEKPVDDLLRMPYRRALRRVYAGAKAQELLCTALQALAAPQDVPGGGVLHDGDRERISRARAILDDSFADPPTVAVLARTVGLNRNKLSYGFRHLHDRSMSDYLAEKRLDAAWRLLQDGVPVGAVAEAVGYRHVGSFSAAFSRRYGLAPSSLRRNKCGTPKSS